MLTFFSSVSSWKYSKIKHDSFVPNPYNHTVNDNLSVAIDKQYLQLKQCFNIKKLSQ